MQFDTKIAVIIRTDLEAWQKLNVASFLAGGIVDVLITNEVVGERKTLQLAQLGIMAQRVPLNDQDIGLVS